MLDPDGQGQKRESAGPLDVNPGRLALNSTLTTGKALGIVADTYKTLFDPTGVVGGAWDASEGNYASLGMSVVVRAGGPALAKFFGVAQKALFSGRLLSGQVGDKQIAAQFTKSGGTIVADIVYVGSESRTGVSTLIGSLYKNIMALAKQEGASAVKINAVAVVNKDLEKKLIDDGWRKTTVWIQGAGDTPAYTKTIRLK